jgi:hypothetical protein
MPFKDETTQYDTWAATCPKCQRTASQDDYSCSNCDHEPLTFVYTVTKYDRRDQTLYGMQDRYKSSMICQVCHLKPGNLECPACGAIIVNDLIRGIVPPGAKIGLKGTFFGLVFWVVVILVILFLILFLIGSCANAFNDWKKKQQDHPSGAPAVELQVTTVPPTEVTFAEPASRDVALPPPSAVGNEIYLIHV